MARTKTRREERDARLERSKRNDFSSLVRAHIRERDAERCVLCGKPGREVHHIIPRSQGGLGTADNGVCLDHTCHVQAHRSKKVEEQLMRFRQRKLLPFYGLNSWQEYIWLDPLLNGLCRCGGAIQEGKCESTCGIVIRREIEWTRREERVRVRNEIGYMEERIEEIIGQQLHLEVENVGVYDFEAVKVFQIDSSAYVLCRCISTGREGEGYLLRADDLGDGWWNVVEITDDSEWERAKAASGWQGTTTVVHR